MHLILVLEQGCPAHGMWHIFGEKILNEENLTLSVLTCSH
jgi:hypothetical protein